MSAIQLERVRFEKTGDSFHPFPAEPVHGLHEPVVEYDSFVDRLAEANQTYDVIRGEDGRTYETVILNAAMKHRGLVLKPSTSFSSILKNPANMLEVALAAAANPGVAYAYVASFGNFPTGHLSARDRKYIRNTGRYTTGHGVKNDPYRPIRGVYDMAHALVDNGLTPTHIAADVEAGRVALGLMTALPKNSVSRVLLNGIDGVSTSERYASAQFTENVRSRVSRRGKNSSEVGEISPVNIKDVKARMPNVYSGLGRITDIPPIPVFRFPLDVRDKAQLIRPYSRYNELDQPYTHAIFNDMSAAMSHQMQAEMTMLFRSESALHDTQACVKLGKLVLTRLREDQSRIVVLGATGTLDQHTDAPREYAGIEQSVLFD